MTDSTVNFSTLCEMLEAISRSKKGAMKRKHIRTFLEHVYKGGEYFSAIRLILPQLDRVRGAYKLKEAQLAKCLTEALGLSKDSPDAYKLLNWRKGGAKAGANAGNFPLVATELFDDKKCRTYHSHQSQLVESLIFKGSLSVLWGPQLPFYNFVEGAVRVRQGA